MAEKKKRPWIGFVGLILIVAGGALFACELPQVAGGAFLVGVVVLIYALITGNVTLFGR